MESIGGFSIQLKIEAGEQKVIRLNKGLPKTEIELDRFEVVGDAVCAFRLLLFKKNKQLAVLRQGLLVASTEPSTENIGKYALDGIEFDANEYDLRLELDSYHEGAIIHLTYKMKDDLFDFSFEDEL